MRIRLPLRRTLFFVGLLLFSLVALLPLRIAVDWLGLGGRGLSAREASGSVWLGGLDEARLGPVALGELQAQLQSLPLLVGRARIDLRGEGETGFEGAASVSRRGFGLEDATGQLDVAALFAPMPVRSVDLDDVTVRFADGRCTQADGKAKATMAGDLGGISLANGFTGSARCDGGALLLPLASQSGAEALNLRLLGDGRYELELSVRPSNVAMAERLAALGFAPRGDNLYAARRSGRF